MSHIHTIKKKKNNEKNILRCLLKIQPKTSLKIQVARQASRRQNHQDLPTSLVLSIPLAGPRRNNNPKWRPGGSSSWTRWPGPSRPRYSSPGRSSCSGRSQAWTPRCPRSSGRFRWGRPRWRTSRRCLRTRVKDQRVSLGWRWWSYFLQMRGFG